MHGVKPAKDMGQVIGRSATARRIPFGAKFVFVISGILLPSGCFLVSWLLHSSDLYLAEVHVTEMGAYSLFVLSNEVALIMSPFVILALAGFTAALFQAGRREAPDWVRVGLMMGVILSVQYSVALATFGIPSLVVIVCGVLLIVMRPRLGKVGALVVVVNLLGIGVWWFYGDLKRHFDNFLLYADSSEILQELLFLLFLLALTAAPGIAFVVYLKLFLRLRSSSLRRWRGSGLVRSRTFLGWIGGYAAAFWIASAEVIVLHQRGGHISGGCYVCTAAAKGHPWLVRSEPVRVTDGLVLRVNDQMRHLKRGELVLAAATPRLHLLLRGIYDTVGPRLARRIGNPWAADCAYLLLKPIEWATRIALRLLP